MKYITGFVLGVLFSASMGIAAASMYTLDDVMTTLSMIHSDVMIIEMEQLDKRQLRNLIEDAFTIHCN